MCERCVQGLKPKSRRKVSESHKSVCSWLEAALDSHMQPSAPDAAAPSNPLLAALPDSSSQGSVLREGLAVGQGRWPTDRYSLDYQFLIMSAFHLRVSLVLKDFW